MISSKLNSEVLNPAIKLYRQSPNFLDKIFEEVWEAYNSLTEYQQKEGVWFDDKALRSIATNPDHYLKFEYILSRYSEAFYVFLEEVRTFCNNELNSKLKLFDNTEKLKRKVNRIEDKGEKVPEWMTTTIKEFEKSNPYVQLFISLPNYVKQLIKDGYLEGE